jgi:Holliday junction resolvase RusA-like endonuclease
MSDKRSKKEGSNSGTVLEFKRSERRNPFWCTLFMDPVPKGRPRFFRGRVITPKKTREFEANLKQFVKTVFKEAPYTGEVSVTLDFGRKRKVSAVPDLDNYVKGVTDSLNGVIWKDDSQITELYASKKYSEKAYIRIRVDPV